MKIRSHHCPDQKRQCLHLIVTIQWNFLPISNALQHLTTPTSPSRHQCPDLTEGPALTQTCKGCSSCSRLCLHLYSLTGRPLLSPVSLCSNVTSTRAVFLVCVCVCVCVYAHDQSSPTLCNPMDCSLPGFFILGTVQARILEWVAISSSRGSSWHYFLSHCFIALYRLSSQAVIYFHPFIHLWIQCSLV